MKVMEKIKLKHGEEQNGLKLLDYKHQLIVVDCSKECYDSPHVWNYSTNTGFIFRGYRRSYGADYDQSFRILFAEPSLKLEGIPAIEGMVRDTFTEDQLRDAIDLARDKREVIRTNLLPGALETYEVEKYDPGEIVQLVKNLGTFVEIEYEGEQPIKATIFL